MYEYLYKLCELAMERILVASGIVKRFGEVEALKGAELTVARGQVHALVGANGAGKSTLIKILTGVLRPDGGQISFEGQERNIRSPRMARLLGIGAVYQEASFVPDLTVSENLRLSGTNEYEVFRWVSRLSNLRVDKNMLAAECSVAALRILDLARVLSWEPKLIILDELTAALPADLSHNVFDVIVGFAKKGVSVILISHRLSEVVNVCDIATVLRDGRTVGVVESIKDNQDRIIVLMLGEKVATGVESEYGGSFDSGGNEPVSKDKEIDSSQDVAVVIENLSYKSNVRNVSFRIRKGEILGLVALEGQGQDQLFECIAGFIKPTSGRIYIDGKPVRLGNAISAISSGIVMVPGERRQALLPQRSVHENIAISLTRTFRNWGPLNRRKENERVGSIIKMLQIDTRAQDEVQRLSGGNQQKVVLARWIVAGFKLLLCYDPTRGVGVETKRHFYSLLRELVKDGRSILYYTSELDEVPPVCDRVLVLYEGEIAAELPVQQATEEALLRAAHGLVAGVVNG